MTVAPVEAPLQALQRYCIRVPSEKPLATTRLEMQFPELLEVVQVDSPPGWRATTQKDRQGRIAGALWEGGSIPARQSLEFGVVARNPRGPAELAWKAIQTYLDGSEVHWIGPPGAQFPAAITKVGGGPIASARACASGAASSATH